MSMGQGEYVNIIGGGDNNKEAGDNSPEDCRLKRKTKSAVSELPSGTTAMANGTAANAC